MNKSALPILATVLVAAAPICCCGTEALPTVPPTPVTAPTTTATSPPRTYGDFSVILVERHNSIEIPNLVRPFNPDAGEPGKGMDALLVFVKLRNSGDRWIFPAVMPGFVVDRNGDSYREEIDFIVDEAADVSQPGVLLIKTESKGPIVVRPPSEETEKIGPGEVFTLGFVFHVPQNRVAANFMFKCTVCETADPLIGEPWYIEATVPLSESR